MHPDVAKSLARFEQAAKDVKVGLEDRVASRYRLKLIAEGRFAELPCELCGHAPGAEMVEGRVLCSYHARYPA